MAYSDILYEVSNNIAWITLNRPEKMNALSAVMLNEWKDAVVAAGKDDAVRVVVVTGAGRAFCAGMDLKSLGDAKIENGEVGSEIDTCGQGLVTAISNCPKPVIGMINGPCMTGGLELTLVFDILIASEEAKFADTHARWGIRPSWGLSQHLPRIVGAMRAKELSFTGRTFNAEEAREYGLINKIVPADKLKDETIAIAEQIIKNSGEAITAMKDLYNKGMGMSLAEGLEYEWSTHYIIKDTADRIYGFKK